MLEGRTITVIKPIGGLVAGQHKHYELWTQGGFVTITDTKSVDAIDKVLNEARIMNTDSKAYLQYMIEVEGILN